ncbi:MAG: hypothetical protein ACLP5V_15905 [Candidatus Bathyarchaeia archaeon]
MEVAGAKTKDNYRVLRESSIYGRELTNTARIAKMNMIDPDIYSN